MKNSSTSGQITRKAPYSRYTYIVSLLKTALPILGFTAWAGSQLVAQDYTITTTGNVIVVTDLSGNGDNLSVSESGGNIRFSTAVARTYSLDSGPTMNFPVEIPLSGVTAIVIHAAAGNDAVSIGAFTVMLPSLTVNGGTGNDVVTLNGDITFAAGANLDLDLQNDDASPGTDAVTIATNANILLSGSGTATVKVSQRVIVNAGGSLVTEDGDLILETNQQATPTTGSFTGIDLSGGTLEVTGMGNIVSKGTAGSGGGFGIRLGSAGKIKGGTSGTTTVVGKGGLVGNNNYGIYLQNAGALITSTGGDVSVTGTAGGSGISGTDYGVYLLSGGQITAGGNGSVTVEGTGGLQSGNFNNSGVRLSGASSFISSSGGDVSVIGQGGGRADATTGNNHGVHLLNGAKISAGGSGTTTVQGTGGPSKTSGDSSHGVFLTGAGVQITSSSGHVNIIGESGIGSNSNIGVNVVDAAQITTGSNGSITIEGTSERSTGVVVSGANTQIASENGNISITGQGGSNGVTITGTGLVGADGMGSVTIQGTGGNKSSSSYGVFVNGIGSKITSADGNVQITGQGGAIFNTSRGVVVFNGEVSVSGSGTLSVHGTGASTQTNGDGIALFGSGKIIGGTSGAVTINGIGSINAADNGNRGVAVQNTSQIGSLGADVQVTGAGGGIGVSGPNPGIEMQSGAKITAGGNGVVTVQGTGGPGSGSGNYGININGLNSQITSSGGDVSVTGIEGGGTSGIGIILQTTSLITTATNGGNLSLVANSMSLNATVSTNTSSSVTLLPYTNGVAIDLGAATDPIGGPLSLTDTELDFVTTGALLIGDAASGDISISAAIALPAATDVELHSGGDIHFNAGFSTAGGNLLLDCGNAPKAIYPIFDGADTDLGAGTLSFGSDLSFAINGATPGDGSGSTYTQLQVVGTVDLTNTALVLGGSYTEMDGDQIILIDNDGADAVTGTFAGLAEGAFVSTGPFDNYPAKISYTGGTGNDVVLTVVAPDYTISTAGGNLVVTDEAGNSDGLSMLPAGANVVFNTTTARTYALNGGAILNFPVTINNVSAFSHITINQEEGDDQFQIGAFSGLQHLTINGGTGDDVVNFNGDITFASNANLDADLQNDDAAPGIDAVHVAANANLILSGTGTATVRVSKRVLINAGGSIETANGDLTVEANQQATPTAGNFAGIDLNGGILKTNGTGALAAKGTGGDSGGSQFGILVRSGGQISGGTSAAVTVQGTGGATSGFFNYGVTVQGTNTRITSSGGDVSVTGQGGGTGSSEQNHGVYVSLAGQIIAGGNGKVTVQGTGGATTGSFNYGVFVADAGSRIRSSGGDVSVTGQGGGTGASANNYGVYVIYAGEITAGGGGKVAVQGTGGAGTSDGNIGVYVIGSNSRITSSGGDVSATGQGGGAGASANNYGVYVFSAGQITAGGSGKVTVQGTGGATTRYSNYGVSVYSAGSRITSSGGDVRVTGQGGGTGASSQNYGVSVGFAGQITAGGSGKVTVQGTGGATTGDSNNGVSFFSANSRITSSGGDVRVTGQGGGSGTSANNYGVYVFSAGQITAGGSGKVTVQGTGGETTGNNNYGVSIDGSNSRISSSGGDVSVTGQGGGSGASSQNYGVLVVFAGQITAGGSGKVNVQGTGGATTGFGNDGVSVFSAGSLITSSGGDVHVTGIEGNGLFSSGFENLNSGAVTTATNGGHIRIQANSMNIGAAVSTNTSSSVTLLPYTNGVAIDLGAATDPIGGPLGLTDTELDLVTTGALHIGDANTGNITVGAAITRPAGTAINLRSGNAVNLNASALNSAGGNVTIDAVNGTNPNAAGNDVNTGAGSTLSFAAGNKLHITINGTAVDVQYDQLHVIGQVDITGVELEFDGSYTVAECETYTILNNDGADAVTGTFVGLPEGAILSNFRGSGLDAVLTYTGGDGNDVVITLPDVSPPVTVCPGAVTVTCSSQVPAVNPAEVTANDNCGPSTRSFVSDVTSNMTCADRKTITRTYRATDASGNSTTCTQVITVFDNVKPIFTFVPANVTVQCNSIPAVGNPMASDNCGGTVSIAYDGQTVSNILCTDKYTLTRQWTATDACGNTQTATQRIVVTDTQKPNFTNTPANVTVQCTAVPPVAAPTATDNCDAMVAISYIGQTRTNGTCPNAYTLTRRWVASDNCGNTKTISQRITVVDTGKPVFTSFPANTTIACNAALPPVGSPAAYDGCGSATVTYLGQSTTSGNCPGNYQIRRTWRATDVCGNSTVSTQTIQVSDTGAPVFTTVPPPLTIQCNQPLPPLVHPTANDACGYASITFLGNVYSGSGCAADYTITRTWRAEDLCGNSATTSQVITVLGNSFGDPEPETLDRLRPMATQMTRIKRGFAQINPTGDKSVEIRVSTASSALPSPALGLQPNPTTDRIQLDLTDFAGESVTVSIFSDLGQLVWERRIPAVEELKLPISLREAGAAAGIYTVSVRSASGVVAKRVVLVE